MASTLMKELEYKDCKIIVISKEVIPEIGVPYFKSKFVVRINNNFLTLNGCASVRSAKKFIENHFDRLDRLKSLATIDA